MSFPCGSRLFSAGVKRVGGDALQQPREPGVILFVVDGRIDRRDVRVWCERFRVLLESSVGDEVVCDVGKLARVDLTTVEVLVRLQLTARQYGRRMRVRHASAELADLLALVGLSEVVSIEPSLALQAQGQAEEREELRGVQEEADPGNSAV